MSVFIDAERLEASNQYNEKYIVRNKVLELIFEIYKKNPQMFLDNILSYAHLHSEDTIKMLTLLMSDVSDLSDEVILKLKYIRKFQIIMSDKEKWYLVNDEEKKMQIDKYIEFGLKLKTDFFLVYINIL